MCVHLREIYDKKSPIFLVEIFVLTATLLIILAYPAPACQPPLAPFYRIVLIVSCLEMFTKTVVLAVVHSLDKQKANVVQNILVGVFVVCHLALWIYSIILFNQSQTQSCRQEQPHYFFILMYMLVYGILLIGSIVLLLVLMVPVAVLTLFSIKRKRQSESIEESI